LSRVFRCLAAALASLAFCGGLAACGRSSESTATSGTSPAAAEQMSASTSRGLEKRARQLVPRQIDFGANARSERRLGTAVLEKCNLEELFLEHAKAYGESPLIRNEGETYLVFVGLFPAQAATDVYRSLIASGQGRCYVTLIRGLYKNRRDAVGHSEITVHHGHEELGVDASTAFEVKTKLHYPSRTFNANASLGVLKRDTAIYLMANFGWGNRPNPLTVFDEILASRRSSMPSPPKP
jgi:uncharacterized membrane protein